MYLTTIPVESGYTLLLEWASGDLWLLRIVAGDDKTLTDSEGMQWSRDDYDILAGPNIASGPNGLGGAVYASLTA